MKKTAIITGGSRGIGFAVAKRLADDGFNIVVSATGAASLYSENFGILEKSGIDFLYVQGDISCAVDRDRLLSEAVVRFGGVHVLVNNAGVAPKVRTDLLEMTEESFDRVISINTKSVMFMSQIVANQMLKQDIIGKKRGTIINISSFSSMISSTSRGEYCVSKAGVSMLTMLFADRLAGEGILVHELRPGIVLTDMTSTVKGKYDALIETGLFPIARWGFPEDVANAVSVFAGDDFLYTTGNYVNVDGGFHIRRL